MSNLDFNGPSDRWHEGTATSVLERLACGQWRRETPALHARSIDVTCARETTKRGTQPLWLLCRHVLKRALVLRNILGQQNPQAEKSWASYSLATLRLSVSRHERPARTLPDARFPLRLCFKVQGDVISAQARGKPVARSMLGGSPRAKEAMLSAHMSTTRCRASSRCHPMCGVRITLSRPKRGESSGSGGGGADPSPKTSSAAPAMRFSPATPSEDQWRPSLHVRVSWDGQEAESPSPESPSPSRSPGAALTKSIDER